MSISLRLIAAVLAKANAWAAIACDEDAKWLVYSAKNHILETFGTRDGFDLQRITLPCRACSGRGYHGYGYLNRSSCNRCRGSGVWDYRFYRLQRWKIGGRTFHIPQRGHTIKAPWEQVTIKEKVRHDHPGRWGFECAGLLVLLTKPDHFPRVADSAPRGWLPMALLARVVNAWINYREWCEMKLRICRKCGVRNLVPRGMWSDDWECSDCWEIPF